MSSRCVSLGPKAAAPASGTRLAVSSRYDPAAPLPSEAFLPLTDFFARAWEMLVGRIEGPFIFRLICQPAMATVLAIRAGLKDAREGRDPYLWKAVMDPASRPELIRNGWKDVRKVFWLALLLDVVYELVVHRWVYPVQAALVGLSLAIVPYLVFRGLTNRLVSLWQRTHKR
jgi:hypothetical protein